ncbi:MAG TPA: response regulator, partial [Xanthomonadaceae bacterium]|nr:response regulator [Xanthomonadaceae bacterium]
MPHVSDEAAPTDGTRFHGARLPCILLVEDDPVSREFLRAAVEALPAQVDAVVDIAGALQRARQQSHAAWLIDAHLPDGHGGDLLRRLRVDAPDTPAIAHTASTDTPTLDGLIAAGFREVLIKPLTAATVQSALRRALSGPPTRVERAP